MHFIDLHAQRARIADKIDAAIQRVLESGQFVLGPAVQEFETALGEFGKASHVLSCANGTEALALPLMAWDLRPGDAVFCPAFTFAATAEVVPWLGAHPVFVDIDPVTYTMDPASLERAIEAVKADGKLKPRAVIAVDLFGQPADYNAIAPIATAHGLKLIADSAQGFGCTLNGEHPVKWADVTTTSFFPAKPLGAYGDGGAILTEDEDLHDHLVSLRVHGQATSRDIAEADLGHDAKYLNLRIGMNSRLDAIQAAILSEKLAVFADEIEARNRIADRYGAGLKDSVTTPGVIEGGVSTWAQYVVEHPNRSGLIAHLRSHDIPTAIYYPIPMHRQPAYERFTCEPNGLPVSEDKSGKVLALPMHPYLSEADQDRIIETVQNFKG